MPTAVSVKLLSMLSVCPICPYKPGCCLIAVKTLIALQSNPILHTGALNTCIINLNIHTGAARQGSRSLEASTLQSAARIDARNIPFFCPR
eukprot:1160675-Pelagomonas_calceolata.AAC.19